MFFNEIDERKSFLLRSGNDLFAILSETYGFEFYVTNRKATYLLAFNHHDYLYCLAHPMTVLSPCRSANSQNRGYTPFILCINHIINRAFLISSLFKIQKLLA